MQDLILTLHIIVCVLLVILILLQSGKEGMGVIFGGGNSSVFGSSGAGGILAKLTTLMAIIFVITSLSYTYVTSSRAPAESSILDVKIEDMPAPDAARSAPPDVAKDGAKDVAKDAGKDAAQPAAPEAKDAAPKAGQQGVKQEGQKAAPQAKDGQANQDAAKKAPTTGQNADNAINTSDPAKTPAPPNSNGQPDKPRQ